MVFTRTLLISLFVCVSVCLSAPQDMSWSHHVVLDGKDKFHVFWKTDTENITFEVQAETHGYVGLGFSPNGDMDGADIFLGWMKDGQTTSYDCYAKGKQMPEIDAKQDYELLLGTENDTHTTLRFRRKLDTCDKEQDLILGNDTMRMIWAYHNEVPPAGSFPKYHERDKRGVKSVFLKDRQMAALDLKLEPHVRTWDLILSNVSVNSDRHTLYWCKIFKQPQLDRKTHLIGYKPLIQQCNEGYVHHMILYECHHQREDSTFYHKYASHRGVECFSPNMPLDWYYCRTAVFAWAIGSEGEMLPDNVGMLVRERQGGSNFYMLETHIDNPTLESDLVIQSGLRLYVTDHLRRHDASTLLVGHEVSPMQIIPMGVTNWTTLGICASNCTKEVFPPEGIKLFSVIMHSHLAGKKLKLRHIRGNVEIGIIAQDNNYDFNYQQSRSITPEAILLPGDEIQFQCTYDTKDRTYTTFGGLSTKSEMCLAFISYYPQVPLQYCTSRPTSQTFHTALGVEMVEKPRMLTSFYFDHNYSDGDDVSGSVNDTDSVSPTTATSVEMSTNLFQTEYTHLFTAVVKAPERLRDKTLADILQELDVGNKTFIRNMNDIISYGPYQWLCAQQENALLERPSERNFTNFREFVPAAETVCPQEEAVLPHHPQSPQEETVLPHHAQSPQEEAVLLHHAQSPQKGFRNKKTHPSNQTEDISNGSYVRNDDSVNSAGDKTYDSADENTNNSADENTGSVSEKQNFFLLATLVICSFSAAVG